MPELFEDLARAALLEITPAATIGDYISTTDEGDGVVSLLFESAQAGYPDWRWTVSVAQVDGEEPTVLEAELMPAEGALLAPDWLPWSERLAEYKAAQEHTDASESDDEPDDEDDDESDDDDDDDESDETEDEELDEDDVLGNDVLHGGDLDGVDIDEPESDDDDDFDDDDDDDDDDDESDDDEEVDRTY
jgi:hypothetical protein